MKRTFSFLILFLPALLQAQPASVKPATVVFEKRQIVTFRTVLAGRMPAQRAESALLNLQALSGMALYDPVKAETIPDGFVFFVGEKMIFALVNGDLERGTDSDLKIEAATVHSRLKNALQTRAEQRSFPFLLLATLYSVLATIVLLVLLKLLFFARRRLLLFLTEKATKRTVFGFDLRARMVTLSGFFVRSFLVASFLFLLYAWITFIFNRFPYTRPWGEASRSFLLTTAGKLFADFVEAVPSLLTVLIILGVVRVITKIIRDFFMGVEQGTVTVPGMFAETAGATRRLINTMLWLFGLVVAYPYIPGSQTDAFKGVSVFVGLIFTLGSAGVVGHLMSGLVLVYSRALKKGDFVRVGEVEGIVTEVGALSTKISNLKKEEFTLPNTMMVSSVIKNYSRLAGEKGVIVSTSVTIGYDAPWRQVQNMLKMAAEQTPFLRKEPAPFVLQTALSDFYVEYQIFAHLESPEKKLFALSVLHQNIQDAFNEFGVQIMSPHYESQPEKPVVVPKSKWNATPAKEES